MPEWNYIGDGIAVRKFKRPVPDYLVALGLLAIVAAAILCWGAGLG